MITRTTQQEKYMARSKIILLRLNKSLEARVRMRTKLLHEEIEQTTETTKQLVRESDRFNRLVETSAECILLLNRHGRVTSVPLTAPHSIATASHSIKKASHQHSS
jgi:hypothetical protein